MSYWDEEEDRDSAPNTVGGPDGESMEGFLDHDGRDHGEADEMDEEDEQEEEEEEEQSDEMINEEDIRSSGSSFAKNLWTCYGGDTLFTQSFSSSRKCQSQDAMMKHALRMRTVHEIASTGYYYYIFYRSFLYLLIPSSYMQRVQICTATAHPPIHPIHDPIQSIKEAQIRIQRCRTLKFFVPDPKNRARLKLQTTPKL